MHLAWFMTSFLFTVIFFLVFFTVYFFRPKKDDKIIPVNFETEILDPEDIVLPHRAEPNWPATIEISPGETAKATVLSVTHGSAFIETPEPISIGEKFQLTIHLPDSAPLQVRAEVTWSNMHLPAEKVIKRGMGIRFVEAGEEAICLISDTLNLHAAALKEAENRPEE